MTARPSPIDGAPMRKIRRYGVELEICTRTGGVWLDPGELERIIAWVQGESDASRRARDADAAEYGFADGEVGRRRPRQRELHWRARLVGDFDD